MRNRSRGQVLPLFAIVSIVLIGMMAIAIDVTSAYAARRAYRTAGDAAALAGGQDLQSITTRAISAGDRLNARTDALRSLVSGLGATGNPTQIGCTNLNADLANCPLPGTPFVVSIKTPVTSCVSCDVTRSVQVTVGNPTFSLSFARIFGMDHWNVATSSVAGLDFSAQYAIITLRPPLNGRVGNQDDIRLNGNGSTVVAVGGDIGVNTGAVLNGNSATVGVDQGYHFDYYGAATDQASPLGANKQINTLIPDPAYPYPVEVVSTPLGGATPCPIGIENTLSANGYGTYLPSSLLCFKPGRYTSTLSVGNGKVGVMLPGIHYLDKGIDLSGTLIGGYQPSVPGVGLIIPYTEKVKLTGTPPFFALNRGSAFDGRAGGQEATPAMSTNETPPTLMSLVVTKNLACNVAVPAPSCGSKTLDFSGFGGHGFVSIAGVVYAPSDNVDVAGGADTRGYLGRIVAWTITYSGGSTFVQHYVGAVHAGLLRLDGACTAPSTPCNP